MKESKKLEKVIMDNLIKIYLKSNPDDWDSYDSETYKLLKENVSIYILNRHKDGSSYSPSSNKKKNNRFVVFFLHGTVDDAKRSTLHNNSNIKFSKEIRISGFLKFMRPKLSLKDIKIRKYIHDKAELFKMKEAFNSLPLSVIRKEKLEKLDEKI